MEEIGALLMGEKQMITGKTVHEGVNSSLLEEICCAKYYLPLARDLACLSHIPDQCQT
jgi:hypothetical protein